jgi:hypothetical protein
MKTPRRKGSYKGALAKPIILRPAPTFSGSVVPKRLAAHRRKVERYERAKHAFVEQQFSKKLAMLSDHYSIPDKPDMGALARALAVEHVPGFRIQFPEGKSGRGRKRKWLPDRLEELYQTVESIKLQHRLTDKRALKFIVNNPEHAPTWGVPTGHKGSKEQWIETLESRLQDAKRLQKLYDQAERDLGAAAEYVKFRK